VPRKIDEEQLFKAVLQIWVRKGYAGTTTKRVAESAGVNEATLYRRYGDKAELVCRALSDQIERVPLRQLQATDDVRHDLLAIVDAYLQTHQQVGNVFPLLMIEVARHPELLPALESGWVNVGAVVQIVAHHQARGALREEPPMNAANALLGPLFVQLLMAQAQPDRIGAVDITSYVDGFLRGRATTTKG
jgi:AcrR family transcriptional regulator